MKKVVIGIAIAIIAIIAVIMYFNNHTSPNIQNTPSSPTQNIPPTSIVTYSNQSNPTSPRHLGLSLSDGIKLKASP